MNNKAPKRIPAKKQRAAHSSQRTSNAPSRAGHNDLSNDFFDSFDSRPSDDAISRMEGRPVASRAWLDDFPTNDDGYVQLLMNIGHDNASRAAREARFNDGSFTGARIGG